MRTRCLVHLLSQAVFQHDYTLPDFPRDRTIHGKSLSDWGPIAKGFAKKFDYANTFYHQEPFLDITDVPDEDAGSLDFLISSDVFEHVGRPVQKAFDGARKILKDGGALILTVPYMRKLPATVEHFPILHDWKVETEPGEGEESRYVLIDRQPDGTTQSFRNLRFHGGPGQTLEMRVFSYEDLIQHLWTAGFSRVDVRGDTALEYGIHWQTEHSLPIVAIA